MFPTLNGFCSNPSEPINNPSYSGNGICGMRHRQVQNTSLFTNIGDSLVPLNFQWWLYLREGSCVIRQWKKNYQMWTVDASVQYVSLRGTVTVVTGRHQGVAVKFIHGGNPCNGGASGSIVHPYYIEGKWPKIRTYLVLLAVVNGLEIWAMDMEKKREYKVKEKGM